MKRPLLSSSVLSCLMLVPIWGQAIPFENEAQMRDVVRGVWTGPGERPDGATLTLYLFYDGLLVLDEWETLSMPDFPDMPSPTTPGEWKIRSVERGIIQIIQEDIPADEEALLQLEKRGNQWRLVDASKGSGEYLVKTRPTPSAAEVAALEKALVGHWSGTGQVNGETFRYQATFMRDGMLAVWPGPAGRANPFVFIAPDTSMYIHVFTWEGERTVQTSGTSQLVFDLPKADRIDASSPFGTSVDLRMDAKPQLEITPVDDLAFPFEVSLEAIVRDFFPTGPRTALDGSARVAIDAKGQTAQIIYKGQVYEGAALAVGPKWLRIVDAEDKATDWVFSRFRQPEGVTRLYSIDRFEARAVSLYDARSGG